MNVSCGQQLLPLLNAGVRSALCLFALSISPPQDPLLLAAAYLAWPG